ncbi:MAG: ribokinase [Anaerolineae bacterium]|nr:ribokinase [Anaerolineae bacterium]MDW8171987.1 ribokinase [Anaerolineae bacterium]
MVAKIVVVGSFNADLVTDLERIPRPGETVFGQRFVTVAGGKGSNQAVACARLGAQVTFVGCVGQDNLAELGLALWQHEGIRTHLVARSATQATGVAVIFVETGGQNVIVVTPGANNEVTAQQVEQARQAIAEADFVLAPLETPLEGIQHAFAIAQAHNVRTILNPAPARPLPAELLALCDYLTPNEHELALIAPQQSAEQAASSLLSRPQQALIVTLGEQGAHAYGADGRREAVPAFAVDVLDTVGAGDAFNGGLAVALAEGAPMPQALRFANAVAALSVTRRGAADSMPIRSEVEAFLAARTP